MYKVSKTYKNLRFSDEVLKFIVIGLIILSSVIFVNFFNLKLSNVVNSWEGKVYKGVTINNVDVSGFNESALKEFLITNFSSKSVDGNVAFRLGDKVVNISYDELGFTYDYDKAVEEAFKFYKEASYFQKLMQIANTRDTLNINLVPQFNVSENIDHVYNKLSDSFSIDAVNATVSIVDGQVMLTESKAGLGIDKEHLIKMINDTNPSNASQNGIEITTKSVDPKISTEVLSKINGKISSYSTSFKSSTEGRAGNIELSASSINGKLLMPGESFSFNKIVGPRTRERGYKDAPIIVGNVYESGLGGGICQTSSTLHQAVVTAGIIPSQRRSHSLPTSYMPLGFDAAVAWGSLDYVFKNPYNFPILIDVSTVGRTLTISIYGDVTAIDKTYSVASEKYESVPYTTKYVKDNTIEKGKEVVEKNGSNGTKVKVYVVTKNKYTGEVIDKKLTWNDYYVPQQKVVLVGTK